LRSMPIRTLIIDDEVLARQKLLKLLREEPDIEVVGEGANGTETIDLIQLTSPDLLLLDVHMAGMDGFDLVANLNQQSIEIPRIIFTTAYNQYALRAFEVRAVDYLLKPFTRERLKDALQRVREQIAQSDRAAGKANGTSQNEKNYTNRLIFRSKGRILFLPVSEIRWVCAEENYVRICTAKETHLLRDTMTNFESKLDPSTFLRVHRSAIVNLQYVREFRSDTSDGDSHVLMLDGHKLPVSRGFRSRITSLVAR
jgi:two-component system, LytTR family, response regulator